MSIAQSLADELALTPFKVWFATDGFTFRANVRAPNSFAARLAFMTLVRELEPEKATLLPPLISLLSLDIGSDNSWATLECCLQCKGAGEMMSGFNREGYNIHLRQCTNCGGAGGFLTVDDASKGIIGSTI